MAELAEPDAAGKAGWRRQVHTKQLGRVEIKDADRGEFTAVLATLDVIDADGDVTRSGAFDTDEFPVSAYGHKSWDGALPVGVARVTEVGAEAILEGRFFLDTTGGRDTFTTVKNLGPLGPWSYGYDAVQYSFGEHDGAHVRFLERLKVHEASPVLIGAGVNTRTLTTKSRTTFAGEAAAVVAAVTALADRAADVMARRRPRGKGLGADSRALVAQVTTQLDRLTGLLADPEPPTQDDVQREYLRMVARRIA